MQFVAEYLNEAKSVQAAKMTAQCALYMGVMTNFGTP